jgi:hypothetical protein
VARCVRATRDIPGRGREGAVATDRERRRCRPYLTLRSARTRSRRDVFFREEQHQVRCCSGRAGASPDPGSSPTNQRPPQVRPYCVSGALVPPPTFVPPFTFDYQRMRVGTPGPPGHLDRQSSSASAPAPTAGMGEPRRLLTPGSCFPGHYQPDHLRTTPTLQLTTDRRMRGRGSGAHAALIQDPPFPKPQSRSDSSEAWGKAPPTTFSRHQPGNHNPRPPQPREARAPGPSVPPPTFSRHPQPARVGERGVIGSTCDRSQSPDTTSAP